MEIRELDPSDPAMVDAWWATYAAADAYGRTDPVTWQLEECRTDLRASDRRRRLVGLVGVEGERCVCSAAVSLPMLDNRDQAVIQVFTDPDHRRRGHGTAMLGRLEEIARAHARSVLLADATYPYDGPAENPGTGPDGAGHPNIDFLLHRGFTLGLGDVRRTLATPVAPALLARLVHETAPHHREYTLRSFQGRVPEDLAASYAVIVASLNTEAPAGEITREAENADVGVMREGEELLTKQGRTKYVTVALDKTGEVAAFSDLVTTVHEPGRAYQWGTVVRREDRGHRLGMAVKAANLAFLQERRPDVGQVSTYNAEVNPHMVAVNDALGFRAVERLGEFHRRI